MTERRLAQQVRIVGSGLLGASIGLGLREHGVDVVLDDASPSARRLAIDYGAGRAPAEDDAPGVVVVAVPPDVTAAVVQAELERFPDALVTDVASVKLQPLEELRARGADLSRYLGSHPMAGRERGGAVSARADLFAGRPWILAGHDGIAYRRAAALEDLVLDLGAIPVEMDVAEHDRSVALVSHAPQLVASLLAARLRDGADRALGLAGQGLRDTTRIASSDPALWVQILAANADAVREVLEPLRAELDAVIGALGDIEAPGARRVLAEAIAHGNAGVGRIPGKHGQDRRFASLTVKIDDTPGQLARLLTEIGEEGVNMEDLRLEHSPGAQLGFAEIAVVPDAAARLAEALTARGWSLVEAGR
ncbi:prephenate dehydrogenase [Homoserinibacter sp. YIM 151385]|uniref:prephenate dehydrogenase n=1 Tax=Homoserinibacter sp. YIM 151385 TaxID=2985506 RepID=UPI0022F0D6BB|nr:prephenate dehydrogenase [Homoserinibacter sp. YIM 151385]WBU38844.1 prephenate dehydrogenase [Homoserinibacter sp. YIM 151385]